MPVGRDRREIARLLDLRLRNAAWWMEMMDRHPGGIVTVGVMSRMMGVSKSRISELIRIKRFTVLDGLPSGHPRMDRFIPFREFLSAPNALYRGHKFTPRPEVEVDEADDPEPRRSGPDVDRSRYWPSTMGLNSDFLPKG